MSLWPADGAAGPAVDAAGHTATGPVRTDNEDWFLVDRAHGLFAVADGMGGHKAGEVASHLAVSALVDALTASRAHAAASPPAVDAAMTRLREAVLLANDAVCTAGEEDPELAGMGTTLTAVLLEGATAAIVSVGDSRAYRLRGGHAEQLTSDDTWLVSVLGEDGAQRAAAQAHPMRHVLTSVIGSRDIAAPEVVVVPLEPGDVLVLTTDGLHNVVDEAAIGSLGATAPAGDAARRLVDEAIVRRTTDNVTAVVVRC